MNYRSIADLNAQVVHSLPGLPAELELVVGIPRSGMLVANLLSLHLNLPLTDVDGLLEGRLLRGGARLGDRVGTDFLRSPRHVFVVDDSVCSGTQMRAIRRQLEEARLPHRIRYGAVYMLPETVDHDLVDWFAELVPGPRVFEWNLMHNDPILSRTCMALEGVLCRTASDPDPSGMAVGPMAAAEPLYRPTRAVGWIVSRRPESDRPAVEAWLERHGVEYGTLILAPDAARPDAVVYKADAYQRTGSILFVEARPEEALPLAAAAGKPVFCMADRELYYPDGATQRQLVRIEQVSLGFSRFERALLSSTRGIRWLTRRTLRRITGV